VIYWHEACVEHNVPQHPEKPGRVTAILNALREKYTPNYFREAPLVTDEQILLYHTTDHLEQFKQLCDAAERAKCEKEKSGSSLQVPLADLWNGNSELYQSIDGDTVVMWRTREAAYRAAGSIIAAIDSIFLPADHPERIK
jgi:acetoin utilization deacetylase AcuC-like enzyme